MAELLLDSQTTLRIIASALFLIAALCVVGLAVHVREAFIYLDQGEDTIAGRNIVRAGIFFLMLIAMIALYFYFIPMVH